MGRQDLWLDGLLQEEADISEQSPYLGIISASASSSTVSTNKSITTPSRPPLQEGSNDVPQTQLRLSRKKSLGQLASPSSPTLPRFTRPKPLVRSQTLPRVTQIDNKPRRRQAELDQIALAPEMAEKVRRWIISIAIGMYAIHILNRLLSNYEYVSVDFDVDDGPVIDGMYPSSMLTPAEAENL